jgi:tetratricopeptide (TPR) repeat protein/tRNA A-37 threonylcarbamoyl transferase component Bud32
VTELLNRLSAALGDTYRLEKELGGGGMSRVFLAEEIELGRRVVIKVLPPDMAAGVNQDRFRREVQLAASLQHPHIVPLLTAGSAEDLLYYIMPYIEGESLRAKLSREEALPVAETVHILSEVLDALAHAHGHGVVHRDIKPDNVLLSGKHALVTDFGVAKAVSESTGGGSSLTSLGMALGTPAYMSPEQAAANPNVDHRADIYAVGALAYEMLCGNPPFGGGNPQAVLAAHVTQIPEPCTKHRPAVPDGLNSLVMRCLEKHPADRWQSAEELQPQLQSMTTPSGGITPTGTQPVVALSAEIATRQAHPIRLTSLFGLASIGALAIVYFLVQSLGLPDWVFFGAIALLAIGFPIMLLTGHHERRRAAARTTGVQFPTPAGGMQRWFTWRRALLGGAFAFASLGVVTTVYMGMRAIGIGPVGTLMATGALEERARILLADFENRTTDSSLGPSVTDAFRVDLAQSRAVKLVDASLVADALRRMERGATAPLNIVLAREVAQREGINAIVTGEIGPVGRGYGLSASVMSTSSGEVLTAVRETAGDDGAIIDAIDQLSAKLRERIGESLRDIRGTDPLERVTTASMDALRSYSQGLRAEQEGQFAQAVSLLEDAIAIDTAFAMAHRKLAVILSNANAAQARIIEASAKAFEHRDRLPDLERNLATAYYYSNVEFDRTQEMAAYRSVLELDPEQTTALNNLALALNDGREWEEAERLALRALEVDNGWTYFFNAAAAQLGQDNHEMAEATLTRMETSLPGSPHARRLRAMIAMARRDWEDAEREWQEVAAAQRDPFWQSQASFGQFLVDEVRGKLASAAQHIRRNMAVVEERGLPGSYIGAATALARLYAVYREAPEEGIREVEAALGRYPLESIPAPDRPYPELASFYLDAGRPERAKELLAAYEATVDESQRRANGFRHGTAGALAAALALREGRVDEAVALYRAEHDEHGLCGSCWLYDIGQSLEVAGEQDSAVVLYERAISTPGLFGLFRESRTLAGNYRRLGEVYEERGEIDKAVDMYDRFVKLWQDADAELQPVVEDVRGRIARLIGER